MWKGLLLGASISVFIVSLIFFSGGLAGLLQENIITGAVIGKTEVTNYSLVGLLLSFIACLFFLVLMFRKK